jgi:septal ring factor EnvC (AmiA/AmiB activator)
MKSSVNIEEKEYCDLLDKLNKAKKTIGEVHALIDDERNNLDDRISKDGQIIKELKKENKEQATRINNLNYMYDLLEDKNKYLKKENKELKEELKRYKNAEIRHDMKQWKENKALKETIKDIRHLSNIGDE